MANRINLLVLGNTIAPYTAGGPQLQGTNISETWSVNITQLQTFRNCTAAQTAAFPNALSSGYVLFNSLNSPNTVKSVLVYTNVNEAAITTAANS